jgi:hypothetical protein
MDIILIKHYLKLLNNNIMFRVITLVFFLMFVSCEKDDFEFEKRIKPPKSVEIKKEGYRPPKKRKFRLFKRKPYKVPKSSRKNS